MPAGYEDLKNDYELMEELIETITLTPNTSSGFDDSAAVTDVRAVRVAPPTRGMGGGDLQFMGPAGLTSDGQIFRLFDTTLGDLKPEAGYKITDEDGNEWIITASRRLSVQTGWKVFTVNGK